MLETEFINENIGELSDQQLPQIERLQLQPLAKQYAALNLSINLVKSFLLLTVGIIVYVQPWFSLPQGLYGFIPYALLTLALLSVVFIPLGFMADKQKQYALREVDLHFSSGLIFKKLVSQPISRIQHVELVRGPLERYKNLATLQVFSAGGAHYTFKIPGLSLETAKHIHQFILQNKDLIHHG